MFASDSVASLDFCAKNSNGHREFQAQRMKRKLWENLTRKASNVFPRKWERGKICDRTGRNPIINFVVGPKI